MNVHSLWITVFYGKKKYRIYFEDITKENEVYYDQLYDELIKRMNFTI
jgi:hypothetical protein